MRMVTIFLHKSFGHLELLKNIASCKHKSISQKCIVDTPTSMRTGLKHNGLQNESMICSPSGRGKELSRS